MSEIKNILKNRVANIYSTYKEMISKYGKVTISDTEPDAGLIFGNVSIENFHFNGSLYSGEIIDHALAAMLWAREELNASIHKTIVDIQEREKELAKAEKGK